MRLLVCIKRVPLTGARLALTQDELGIETRNLGFTIGPHEECAVEAAVQLVEKFGGTVTVLTLGPEQAVEQLRGSMAVGADSAILLQTEGEEWGAESTAAAIVAAVRDQQQEGEPFDAIFFGNESADAGGYQVGIRVARALDLACVNGVKSLEIDDGVAIAGRQFSGGWETYQVPLPAVFMVKEGLNLPRYPSLPGRLRAKKKPVHTIVPSACVSRMRTVRLRIPQEQSKAVEILGSGPGTAPAILSLLKKLGGL